MVPTARQWISDGRALVLPRELSIGFDKYLASLPWLGSGLDWSRMPRAEVFDVAHSGERDLLAWAKRTRIGAHDCVAVWYSADHGGVVVPVEVGFLSLDELYREAPGVRFAFGVDFRGGQLEPEYGDLLQYGSGDELVAVGR